MAFHLGQIVIHDHARIIDNHLTFMCLTTHRTTWVLKDGLNVLSPQIWDLFHSQVAVGQD